MGLIQYQRPWDTQPQEATGLRPDGFLRDARFVVLGSAPEADQARGGLLDVVGYTKKPGSSGVFASSSASAGNSERILGPVSGDLSGSLTLVWVGRLSQSSSTAYDTLFSNGLGANGIGIGLWGAPGADLDKPYFETFSGSSTQRFTPISGQVPISKTDVQVVVGVTDANTLWLYQNGVLVSSASVSGALPGTSSSPWRLGARGSFTSGAAQDVALAGALSGARSAREVADFTRNVWAAFSPRTLYIPTAAAGGGVTLGAASSTQASTSSATALAQTHALGAAASTQARTSAATGLTQTHALGAAASTQAQTSSATAITLGTTHVLGNAASTQAQTSAATALTQRHLLGAATSTQASTSTATALTLGTVTVLGNASSTQGTVSTATGIVQTHALGAAASAQAQSSAATAIVQRHVLGNASSTHGRTSSATAIFLGTAAPVRAAITAARLASVRTQTRAPALSTARRRST